MTTGIVSHRAGIEAAAARVSRSAADPQTRGWQSLYQRQRLERGLRDEEGGAADPRPASLSADRRKADEKGSPTLATIVIPAGGHPELAVVESGESSIAPALSEDPVSCDPADEPAPRLVPAAVESIEVDARGIPGLAVDSSGLQHPRATGAVAERRSQSRRELAASTAGADAATAIASVAVGGLSRLSEAPRAARREAAAPADPVGDIIGSPGLIQEALPGSRPQEHDPGPEGERRDLRESERTGDGEIGIGAQRYGTVPLLISGQLLELEFVALGAGPGRAPPAVQRILITYQTPDRGRVELTAQNQGDRVTVRLEQSGVARAAARPLDIPALLRRFGWTAIPFEIAMAHDPESEIGAMR
jgi:hypothetical protein